MYTLVWQWHNNTSCTA